MSGKKRILITLSLITFCLNSVSYAEEISEKKENLAEFSLSNLTVEAPRPDWEEKLSPGTVTVIRPSKYKGEQKSLPDLLKEVPGVHVREVNGKGQYTTVTVRGSTAAQVGVFIDGVMSNLGGDTAVDLSTIPVKNVDRIEVYRGYIPSRFGGTFMGGVVNVVTKKPLYTSFSAEVGKKSFGGKSISMETTAPLGTGSILVGANYESSDGDFKYRNYAAPRAIPRLESSIEELKEFVADYSRWSINSACNFKYVNLLPEQIEFFENNYDAWMKFFKDEETTAGLRWNFIKTYEGKKIEKFRRGNIDPLKDIIIRDYSRELKRKARRFPGYSFNTFIEMDWLGEFGEDQQVVTKDRQEKVINEYKETHLRKEAEKEFDEFKHWDFNPETAKLCQRSRERRAEDERKLKYCKDNRRHRRYNDYRNQNYIIKWQSPDTVIKFAYDKIDRHLPDTTWGDSAVDAGHSFMTDVEDIFYADSRKQNLMNFDTLVEKRYSKENLEWGWRLDYLHQDKKYKAEHKLEWTPHVGSNDRNIRWNILPLREWSHFKSNKYNLQLDGTYKIDARQMLDFQTNYSHEELKVDGSLMNEIMSELSTSVLGQMRNQYKQNIFNIQVQDSIILDKKGDWVLTPALRYNQSEIIGYSNGKRFGELQYSKFHWIHEKDTQTDGKATWQLALKKKFNDNLTMRATGGTYYRLLNMYEIAGDGAGILPASRDGKISVFPLPEEGKQFDFSVLWDGNFLGSDNNTIITYFWKDSDNMLQLYRAGLDYWSYFNDNRGKTHGWEIQSNFRWNKFNLDLQATQTVLDVEQRNTTVHYDYSKVHPTYQPEWEGNVRFSFTPDRHWTVFTEMHYTDFYFTYYGTSNAGPEANFITANPTTSLTVFNAGLKWKPKENWLFTVGCNDIFDEGPKQKIRANMYSYPPGYISLDFPLQGRTYYATMRHVF